MTYVLPDANTCTWLEAEQAAEVLEALASELVVEAGPRPKGGTITTLRRVARWGGQHIAISRIRHRALRYRIRQFDLQDAG